MKKYKRLIIGMIVSGIICGSISGVIAYSYGSNVVSYTPADDTWNVNVVSAALDSLYTKSKVYKKLGAATTADASTILSGKTAYSGNGSLITGTLTKECINGTVKCTSCNTSRGQKVSEINFSPSKLLVYSGSDKGIIYFNEWNNNWVSFNIDYNDYLKIENDTYNYYFKFNNGSMYFTNWIADFNNRTYSYIACK